MTAAVRGILCNYPRRRRSRAGVFIIRLVMCERRHEQRLLLGESAMINTVQAHDSGALYFSSTLYIYIYIFRVRALHNDD